MATGELAGVEIDLELHEVLNSLVPATPTADAVAATGAAAAPSGSRTVVV